MLRETGLTPAEADEEAEELRYAASQHALARLNLFGVRYTSVVHILWSVLIPLANVAVLYFGGRMLLESKATVGQITGMMGFTGMLMGPVYMIVQTFGELQKSLAAVDRVFDHLREPDELEDVSISPPQLWAITLPECAGLSGR